MGRNIGASLWVARLCLLAQAIAIAFGSTPIYKVTVLPLAVTARAVVVERINDSGQVVGYLCGSPGSCAYAANDAPFVADAINAKVIPLPPGWGFITATIFRSTTPGIWQRPFMSLTARM